MFPPISSIWLRVLFLVLSLWLSACSSKKDEATRWELLDPDRKILESGSYTEEWDAPYRWPKDRPPSGTLRFYHPITHYTSEETWETKGTNIITTYQTWDDKGKLTDRYRTAGDFLDGPFERWFEGQPTESGEYRDGRRTGIWREWETGSQQYMKNTYKDGALWDGKARLYIHGSPFEITCQAGKVLDQHPCEPPLQRGGERYD